MSDKLTSKRTRKYLGSRYLDCGLAPSRNASTRVRLLGTAIKRLFKPIRERLENSEI
jgi:hypothetical protein